MKKHCSNELLSALIDGPTNPAYEFATDRMDVIGRCQSLGKQFAEHFHKIYTQHKAYFKHHCIEMQSWYDSVKVFRFKSNKKRISKTQLYDWFFTACQIVEDLFEDVSEQKTYEAFVQELLKTDKQISELLQEYNV